MMESGNESETIILNKIIEAKEELRDADPALYAKLQTDKRFRQLSLVKEPERSNSLRWLLNEVSKAKSKPFPRSREAFSKN